MGSSRLAGVLGVAHPIRLHFTPNERRDASHKTVVLLRLRLPFASICVPKISPKLVGGVSAATRRAQGLDRTSCRHRRCPGQAVNDGILFVSSTPDCFGWIDLRRYRDAPLQSLGKNGLVWVGANHPQPTKPP